MKRFSIRSLSFYSNLPPIHWNWKRLKSLSRFCSLILLLHCIPQIANLSFAFELGVSNTLDTWYGNWRGMWGADSGAISEAILSIRICESNLRGEFDILHTTYWDQEFRIRDTTGTHIPWKRIEFETPQLSVVLGDFYSTFGQGLILGMEPDVSLQRERFIEGIKVGTKLAWFEFSQIWGVPLEIDRLQKNYQVLNDTSDVLFGLDISAGSGVGNYSFSLSGRGLRLKLEDTLYTNSCGVDFEVKGDWVSWYIEWAQKFGWDRISYEEKKGWGIYSSLDIIPYGINFQFMNYDTLGVGGTGYRYNLLPTLNQSGYQIDEGQKTTRDGIGFQITEQKSIGDIIFTLSHSEVTAREKEKKILEYYLKAEYVDFYGSFKFLSLDGGVDSHFDKRRQLNGELHGSFKNIETTLFIDKVDATWIDSLIPFADIGASIQFPIYNIFTMYFDYTHRSKEIAQESPGIEWYGIGMKVEPSSKIFLDLWGGKERGGFICSGGVCRWVAPFEGFKLKLNIIL